MGFLSGISDFFGLDIGTTAVRVVQLSGSGNNRTVFRFGKYPVNVGTVERADADGLVKMSEAIRQVLIQHQITTRNVVVGVPTRQLFMTVSKFQDIAGVNLYKSLKFRVNEVVPGLAEESKVDYAILDDDLRQVQQPTKNTQGVDNPSQEVDVFVCAVNKALIERQLEMLESINLNVLAFEPDALALVRTAASQESVISILIDVGFRSTDVVVVARNQPRLTLSLEFGTSHIVRQLINVLAVDEPTALDMAFGVGLQGDESQKGTTSAIAESLDLVISNIHKALDFVKDKYPQNRVDKIMLWGDIVYIPGLLDFLSTSFDLSVVVADSWQNTVNPPSLRDSLQALSPTFGVAAGLAERQGF